MLASMKSAGRIVSPLRMRGLCVFSFCLSSLIYLPQFSLCVFKSFPTKYPLLFRAQDSCACLRRIRQEFNRGQQPCFVDSDETEQALCVEVRDLLLFIRVDGHLIKELASGFHVAVWIVRGEEDAVDSDRVHHAQIGLVRQTPALIHRARLLAYVLTSEDSPVEVLPEVFLDGPFQPTILTQRK